MKQNDNRNKDSAICWNVCYLPRIYKEQEMKGAIGFLLLLGCIAAYVCTTLLKFT
nr:MAG TPA: hypothetical protein [Caudoviricetes sp.]